MRATDPYQTRLVVNKTTDTKTHVGTTTTTDKRKQPMVRKKRPVAKMLFFGAASGGAYMLLFSNAALVTNTYTLGGWHAIFPVGTAFAFSFIHGAFASNLLSVLGLEAKQS
ncbi:hypothetical protein [Desulfopila sp. IMCC35008]|uniref:hypothetical protein n=1 Tax=Desulfopila sp. IMCC35008 TaxID=2653858 RepID=UPI0013D7303A|nr:hypothetical protein [Desulfopila sp. IMCC35008]